MMYIGTFHHEINDEHPYYSKNLFLFIDEYGAFLHTVPRATLSGDDFEDNWCPRYRTVKETYAHTTQI